MAHELLKGPKLAYLLALGLFRLIKLSRDANSRGSDNLGIKAFFDYLSDINCAHGHKVIK